MSNSEENKRAVQLKRIERDLARLEDLSPQARLKLGLLIIEGEESFDELNGACSIEEALGMLAITHQKALLLVVTKKALSPELLEIVTAKEAEEKLAPYNHKLRDAMRHRLNAIQEEVEIAEENLADIEALLDLKPYDAEEAEGVYKKALERHNLDQGCSRKTVH